MSRKIYYLSQEELLFLHYVVMDGYFVDYEQDVTEEKKGIKDVPLFLSALNQPKQTFNGEDLYPTILTKAAALMRSLIKNHAFHNGNKRTAVLATVVFLEMNLYKVHVPDSKMFSLAMTIVHSKTVIKIERIVRTLTKYTTEVYRASDSFWKRILNQIFSE